MPSKRLGQKQNAHNSALRPCDPEGTTASTKLVLKVSVHHELWPVTSSEHVQTPKRIAPCYSPEGRLQIIKASPEVSENGVEVRNSGLHFSRLTSKALMLATPATLRVRHSGLTDQRALSLPRLSSPSPGRSRLDTV